MARSMEIGNRLLTATADPQLVQMSAPIWTIATVCLFTKSAGISHFRYGSPSWSHS